MNIRSEQPEDVAAVRQVNRAAFGQEDEAALVDRLRGVAATISLVAVEAGQIVGHCLFSPVEIVGSGVNPGLVLGLAPVAVLPDYQRRGIGSALIRQGLADCDRLGCNAVVVLGHPDFYPRFGFIPAKEKGLRCEYPVPDEAFMVLELTTDALAGCGGTVRYRAEFNALVADSEDV